MNGIFSSLFRYIKIARVVFLQSIQRTIISLKRSKYFSPASQPDAWDTIANKRHLYPSRIFKPKIKDDAPLPLVIMVHGGGFIMNIPSVDDPLARYLSDSCKCIVISIDYRKAPLHPFPGAYEDVVESTLSLLADDGKGMSINVNQVVLCGSSAGGNLVLAAAQDPRLRGKLLGVMSVYPVVNMVPTLSEQMSTRPDASVPDFIGDTWNDVLDLYVGTATPDVETLKDPRLSPTFFEKRENLPKNILFVGCEHDMLCHEANLMYKKLVDTDASNGLPKGDLCWVLIEGQIHGFDHFAKKTQKDEKVRLQQREAMYLRLSEWLSGVLDTQ